MTQELAEGTPSSLPQLGDRYLVEGLLGRGGMARVYRAEDRMLGRTVAIKVFTNELDASVHSDRKRSEMRVLASLNHPSLVTVFDADIDAEPHAFLVMEYVDGPALHERLSSGPLLALDVATTIRDLSEALAVVHAAGIVHRDIKPSNVLLTASDGARPSRAKLADFGIATIVDATRLTVPGTLMGTAAYLAPELLHDSTPAAAADVYSLGLVALESATGVRAFPGTAAESIAARVVSDPLMPDTVPVPLRALISSMTSRDPEDRPTARQVSELASIAARELEVEHFTDPLATMPVSGSGPAGPSDTSSATDAPTLRLTAPPTAPATPTEPHTAPPTAPTLAVVGAEAPIAPRAPITERRRWRPVAAAIIVAGLIAAIVVGTVVTNSAAPSSDVTLPVTAAPLSTHLDQLVDTLPTTEFQNLVVDIASTAASGDAAGALALLGALEQQLLQATAEGSVTSETSTQVTAAIALVRQDLQAILDAAQPPVEEVVPPAPEDDDDDEGNNGNGNGNGNNGNGNNKKDD